LSQCIYGGKIDNDYDQRLLTSFLSKLFTARSFETGFALVANVDGVGGDNRYQLIYLILFKHFTIFNLNKFILGILQCPMDQDEITFYIGLKICQIDNHHRG